MLIRAAREGDAGAVAALWTEAYSGAGPGEGRVEPYSVGEFAATVVGATVLCAEDDDGAVLGVVALRPPGAPGVAVAGPAEAELSRLAVAAAARRQGVGRALARRCLALAREQGAAGVALWSRPYQVEAHRLYESLGFRRAPERDGGDADGRRFVFALGLERGR